MKTGILSRFILVAIVIGNCFTNNSCRQTTIESTNEQNVFKSRIGLSTAKSIALQDRKNKDLQESDRLGAKNARLAGEYAIDTSIIIKDKRNRDFMYFFQFIDR